MNGLIAILLILVGIIMIILYVAKKCDDDVINLKKNIEKSFPLEKDLYSKPVNKTIFEEASVTSLVEENVLKLKNIGYESLFPIEDLQARIADVKNFVPTHHKEKLILAVNNNSKYDTKIITGTGSDVDVDKEKLKSIIEKADAKKYSGSKYYRITNNDLLELTGFNHNQLTEKAFRVALRDIAKNKRNQKISPYSVWLNIPLKELGFRLGYNSGSTISSYFSNKLEAGNVRNKIDAYLKANVKDIRLD